VSGIVQLELTPSAFLVKVGNLGGVVVGKEPGPVSVLVEDSRQSLVVRRCEGVEVQGTGLLEIWRVCINEGIVPLCVFVDYVYAVA